MLYHTGCTHFQGMSTTHLAGDLAVSATQYSSVGIDGSVERLSGYWPGTAKVRRRLMDFWLGRDEEAFSRADRLKMFAGP
jgi:hypothetical protein